MVKKTIKLLFGGVLLTYSMLASAIDLSVGQGKIAAKPIVVVPFAGDNGQDQIDFIISSDLKQSGVFAPISPKTYQDRPVDSTQINYGVFQSLGAAYVVVGQIVSPQTIEFSIADAFQSKVLGSYTVELPQQSLRQGAHKVSDIILEKLTGVRGAFATRLVYINESGSADSKRYKIMLSDVDGYDPIVLLSSRAPLMSPRFSPDGKKIAYVTFEGQQSQIVMQDIRTGKRTLISKAPGINSAPAWSPDGRKIAMVLSKDGNPEVYFKDLVGNRLIRVTNNPRIDTEPVWSPNGRAIYFTSDRDGNPQLYRIDISTGALKTITRSGRYSAGADISADGKRIALAQNNGRGFVVGTIDRQTGRFTGVSQGFVDETPRFSPNGKMLVFTSVENNRSVLKIVNVDGTSANTLSTSGAIRDPDWSNYIK